MLKELNTMTVLHIVPVKRQSVQGRHLQMSKSKDDRGQVYNFALRKNKALTKHSGKSTGDTLTFRKNADATKFNAGLSKRVTNPFKVKKDENLESHIGSIKDLHGLSSAWDKDLKTLASQSEISKQTYLEIKFGLEPNALTERIPRRGADKLIDPKDHTILSKFRFTFYDETTVLKDNSLKGALAIQLAKHHPRISATKEHANSVEHYYYIDEREHTKHLRTQKRNHTVLKASAKLLDLIENTHSSANLSDNILYKVGTLCRYKSGKPLLKGKPTPVAIDSELNKFIQKDAPDQLKNAENFLNVVKLYEDNPTLFNVNFLVQQALNSKVVYFSNGFLIWPEYKMKGEWYKHDSKELFAAFILDHLGKFDPDELNAVNAFNELNKEVKNTQLGVGLSI